MGKQEEAIELLKTAIKLLEESRSVDSPPLRGRQTDWNELARIASENVGVWLLAVQNHNGTSHIQSAKSRKLQYETRDGLYGSKDLWVRMVDQDADDEFDSLGISVDQEALARAMRGE